MLRKLSVTCSPRRGKQAILAAAAFAGIDALLVIPAESINAILEALDDHISSLPSVLRQVLEIIGTVTKEHFQQAPY